MRFEEIEFDKEDATSKIMADFDANDDGNLCFEEFFNGISKWISEARHVVATPGNYSMKFFEEYLRVTTVFYNWVLCFVSLSIWCSSLERVQ